MIYIIGIGPGNDVGYLTINAFDAIQNSDIGIYVGEMIGESIKELFNAKELKTGRNVDKKTVLSVIDTAYSSNKVVALLMPGDVSLYSGQFAEQFTLHDFIEIFNQRKYQFKIIPGISSMNALCAEAKIDLTPFSNSQNIIITSIERLKDNNQFNFNEIETLLAQKSNLIFYQSFRDWFIIQELLVKHYAPETKIIFAYKISWHDEIIIETTLENAEKNIKGKELSKHTIILILPNK
jgi:precorrin-4/cobalt-precorrin-4 C11-methyltransferase